MPTASPSYFVSYSSPPLSCNGVVTDPGKPVTFSCPFSLSHSQSRYPFYLDFIAHLTRSSISTLLTWLLSRQSMHAYSCSVCPGIRKTLSPRASDAYMSEHKQRVPAPENRTSSSDMHVWVKNTIEYFEDDQHMCPRAQGLPSITFAKDIGGGQDVECQRGGFDEDETCSIGSTLDIVAT